MEWENWSIKGADDSKLILRSIIEVVTTLAEGEFG